MAGNSADADSVFEVAVRHNLVQSIRRVSRTTDMHVPASRLEVSTELASNHQRNQCIDGVYRSDDDGVDIDCSRTQDSVDNIRLSLNGIEGVYEWGSHYCLFVDVALWCCTRLKVFLL